VVLAPAAFRY